MGKVITSPVARFPGTVTVSDPLTYPQYFAWKDAVEAAQSLGESSVDRVHAALLPGVIECVEAWNLKDVDPVNFPATPRKAATELMSWLIGAISKVVTGEEEIPNE